jgi:hypothetical protein
MKGGKLRLKGAKRISIKRLRQLARESKRLYRLHTKDANTHVECDNEDDVDDHHGDDQEQCDKQDEEDEEGTISSEHANTHVDFQDLCDNEDDVLFFF